MKWTMSVTLNYYDGSEVDDIEFGPAELSDHASNLRNLSTGGDISSMVVVFGHATEAKR